MLLGKRYAHVGVGREDGKEAGEYSPIFYDQCVYHVSWADDRDRFEMVKWKTMWLSSWPEKPGSVGWDAVRTSAQHMG